MFNINFKDISKKLLPFFLRNVNLLDFLYSLVKPLKDVNIKLVAYVNAINYKLAFNGRVIYLEHYLNNIYDPVLRRIFIKDTDNIILPYIYRRIEAKPPAFYLQQKWQSTTFYTQSEQASYGIAGVGQKKYVALLNTNNNQPDTSPNFWHSIIDNIYILTFSTFLLNKDFTVMVPTSITFDINKMRSEIDYYKAAGKTYTIDTF